MDKNGNIAVSFKTSKAGKLKLIRTAEGFRTVKQAECPNAADLLVEVFADGELKQAYTFEQVRALINKQ